MRKLPAALLAAATIVPVLSTGLSSPSATAATAMATAATTGSAATASLGTGSLAAGLAMKAAVRPVGKGVTGLAVKGAAGPVGKGVAGLAVKGAARPVPRPVVTRVRQVPLFGVDAEALRSLTLHGTAPGVGGAPGAIAGMATSAPSVLTRRLDTASFETLGVTWKATKAQPDLLISVRYRGSTGWSGWDQLDDDTGDDPSAVPAKLIKATGGATSAEASTAVRGGTGPLWVGPSTGVQVRIVVRSGKLPADLKLALVDPGTSGYDAVASASPITISAPAGVAASANPASAADPVSAANPSSAAHPSSAADQASSASAVSASAALSAASANKPPVLSRAQWGADERKVRYSPTYMPTIKGAVLHHTAGRNSYSSSQVPSILRGDYAYHLSRGWSDIGYNALVDRFGRIWEGRAGGLDLPIMGAHAGGFNTDTFGVSMIGNYDVARPSAASVTALAKVVAWKLDLSHRDPLGSTRLTSAGGGTARYPAGRTVVLPVIMGHRNTGYTACPGRYLYPYLSSIRTRVRTMMKASLLDPVGPPESVLRGTKVSITARALAAQSWRLDVTAPFGGGRVARISGSARAGRPIKATWNGRLTGGAQARPGRYRLTLTSSSARGRARPVVNDVLVVPPAPGVEVPATPSSGAGGYYPVTPTRLLDTRTRGRIGLGPNGRVDVPVLGLAGVPATGVTSVVLNLTASGVSDDTSLSVWPTGRKTNRTLTGVPAGVSRSVLVTTRVGGAGTVSIGNANGVTELTVDVVGYFAAGGSSLRSVASTRIYSSLSDPAGKLVADRPRSIPLPATLAGIAAEQITGLVVDVSALSPTGAGTLTAYRSGSAGNLRTLSYRTGESIDNLAFVQVSGGAIVLAAAGTPVDAVLDVRAVLVGPAVGGSTFTAVKPALVVDTRTAGGAIQVGSPRRVVVTGTKTGVPIGASAVVVNVTGIAPVAKTWLRTYAWGQPSSGGVALRLAKGDTRGNLVVVPIGPGGAIAIANARRGVQIRVDVYGYLN